MSYPKISVITPVYNCSKYIEETIVSIIGQNYPNLEYIIIDGGSTDNTVEIIKKYQKFISFWSSEPDDGIYSALEKGFSKSTGEIMAWINADDKYHPWSFKIVGQIFTQLKHVHWITGRSTLFNPEGLCVKIEEKQRWSINRIRNGDYKWIQQENVFWRRELWVNAGGFINTKFKLAADFELWIRFLKYADLHTVNTSLAGFRLHGNQISIIQKSDYEKEVKRILNNHGLTKNSFIFKLLSKLGNRKEIFAILLRTILQLVFNRINKYPSIIYYDYVYNKWNL